MSQTVTITLDPLVWKPLATKAGVVTAQLGGGAGSYAEIHGANAKPADTKNIPSIRISSANQFPNFSEKALVWVRGRGTVTAMTIDV